MNNTKTLFSLIFLCICNGLSGQSTDKYIDGVKDLSGKLSEGKEIILSSINGFEQETGIKVYIATSYGYNWNSVFDYCQNWSQNPLDKKGILIAINTFATERWSQNVNIEATDDVLKLIPRNHLDYVRDEYLIPILNEQNVKVYNEFGISTVKRFVGNAKLYMSLSVGIDHLRLLNKSIIQVSANENLSIKDPDFVFGPVSVKFKGELKAEHREENGWCKYSDAEGSFILRLIDDQIEKEIEISGAKFSFEKKCDSDRFRNVKITWLDERGVSIGKINFIEAKLKSLDLEVSEKGLLSGNCQFTVHSLNDKNISSLVILKKGISGAFSFQFNESNSFVGKFNFLGIENINLHLTKDDKVIAKMKEGAFDANGTLTGDFLLSNDNVNFRSNNLYLNFDDLLVNGTLSLDEGIKINSGHGIISLSGIQGLTDTLRFQIDIKPQQFKAALDVQDLQIFGMSLKNSYISAFFSEEFDLLKISGNFDLQKENFDGKLKVSQFEVTDGALKILNASGSISYQDLKLQILSSEYNSALDSLSLDALVKVETGTVNAVAKLSKFMISKDGGISIGEYELDISLDHQFGPVRVTFNANPEETKEKEKGYRKFTAKATLFLEVSGKNLKGKKEKAISDVDISFWMNRQNEFKDVKINWKGNAYAGKLALVEISAANINLYVNNSTDKEVKGEVLFNTFLNEDVLMSDLIDSLSKYSDLDVMVRKGISGQAKFDFANTDSLVGEWNLNQIKNIKIELLKNDTAIAKIENAGIDEKGTVNGTLVGLPNIGYNSKLCRVNIQDLSVDFQLNAFTERKEFKILGGKGKLEVSHIKNVQGSLLLSIDFDNELFTASVDSEKTNLSAFGMKFQEMYLEAVITKNFDLEKIGGSLKAKHEDFDVALNVPEVLIENGRLEIFKVEDARINYKNFDFELYNLVYQNQLLSINAKVEIKATGDEGTKLEVERFEIDSIGNITIGRIEGELNKNPLFVSFNAEFGDQRFKGGFKGDLKDYFGFEGDIDLGAQSDFYFAYLALKAKTSIPITPVLKISELGGQIGYNYKLTYQPINGNFTGNPLAGNYLIGFSLGIADNANQFEITGNPLIQFGNNKFQIDLIGGLEIPKTNPAFVGNLNVKYCLPENVVSGNLITSLKIPQKRGGILSAEDWNMSFDWDQNNWNIEASNLNASLFSVASFTNGNIALNNSSGSGFTGNISGSLGYAYAKEFSGSLTLLNYNIADYTGEIAFDCSASIDASISDMGFNGELGVSLSASGLLDISTPAGDCQFSAYGICTGYLSYINEVAKIKGILDLNINTPLLTQDISFAIDKQLTL